MGYLSHAGAACCAAGRPCFFVPRHPCNAGAYSCMLNAQYKTKWRNKEMRFLLKLLFAPVMAVLAVVIMVSCVRCRPLQRHPLHPRRHSRLFRSVHTLCGFRQLRRGAAGDRVPHKPLRASHAGGAGWWQSSTSCAICFGTGYMDKAVFRNATSQQQARSDIAPRLYRFIRSRNPHCRRPRRWCR